MSFQELGLGAPLLAALAGQGYEAPTPIQAQAIPQIMAGRDLLGIAQTGTGKTAAFALPILHRLTQDRRKAPARSCRVLVLAPTRELAAQIEDSFRTYGKGSRLTSTVVVGGVSFPPQARILAGGVDILVATPGRLIDHLDQRTLQLDGVEVVVLDEVDQMLDLGFIHAIRRVVRALPKERQSLFFSATMPKEIGTLAGELLRDPAEVRVSPVATTVDTVEQRVVFVASEQKRPLLIETLADPSVTRVLVFTRPKHRADQVTRHLETAGVDAAAIHGNKSQVQRERALAGFRAGRTRVLVATDVAARGLDVDGISRVVNYDLPNVPESYVHRIGRTARAGAAGIAISFCDGQERAYLKDIEKLIRRRIWSDRWEGKGRMTNVAQGAELPPAEEPRPVARQRPSGPSRQQQNRPRGQGNRPANAAGAGAGRGRPQQGQRHQGERRSATR
jgi:ATP-dependent RNA helicase RhlE